MTFIVHCSQMWIQVSDPPTGQNELNKRPYLHIKRYCASLITTVNVPSDMIAEVLSSIKIIKLYMAHTHTTTTPKRLCDITTWRDGRTWIKNFKTCRADPDCLQSEGGRQWTMPPYTFSLTELFMSLCLILLLTGKGKLIKHAFADCQFISWRSKF